MRTLLRKRILLPLSALLAFTGCITIEENYTFKKDGSGTMEYVVDMSEIGDMMKAFEDMDKSGDKKDVGDMGTMDMTAKVAELKKVPGIKKVKVNSKEKYVQRLKFAFADVNALNAALNQLMPDSTGMQHTFFTWEGNTLVRTNNQHARELGSGMGTDKDPSDTTDMTEILATMKYKYSFMFADAINNTAVAEGMEKESPNGKTVKLNTDWSIIAKDPKALDLRIELNK
ncbi:MAG TPA: hypothetical protein PLB89_05580 [Flavobacteriales bacterium]|nr:hypothetical protein [Flavobacteriales bacterium]